MTKSKSPKDTDKTDTSDAEAAALDEAKEEITAPDAAQPESDTTQPDAKENSDDLTSGDQPEIEPEALEAAEQASAAPEQTVIVKKTGFMATLTAGVLAAGAGFLGAQYSSQSWPFEPGPATDPLAVAQQAQDIAEALEARVTDAEARLDTLPEPDLSGVEAQISDVAAAVDAIAARVDALEARPVSDGAPATVDLSDVESEIAQMQDQVAALIAEANVAEQTAAAAAQAQLARAALAQVSASLETGVPFADALAEISAASDISIPETLSSVASEGAPTLAGLQADFDPVARDALAAARASVSDEGENVGDRLTSFLRARTGARSVEPREGDDPDAILSRIGASIATGNIGDALAEAEALPEEARSAMTDWLARAQTRQQALAAAQALSQQLNTN